ncbi:hypothetical protein E2C01_052995 [Portunus trituberculatus]|uniref:Uncharacterized protein n=1 Tax=Portunus trituberculatus TaxID=210409 RepID=A0A5B7GF89_PORTR|nr:hypothetical protein [Portunus trituberculatus]
MHLTFTLEEIRIPRKTILKHHDGTVTSDGGSKLSNKAVQSRGGIIDSLSLIPCLAVGDSIFDSRIFRSSIDCLQSVTRTRIWGTEGSDDGDI